ncbi:MAG: protein TolR [Alphaproteobacteria bacterium]|nr:protein TolR [Alphaproteobacteria bacterium]
MGASLNGGGQSGRGRHARKHGPVAEINVTPMVDVMLVLLIIFMVTAPLLTAGVPVDLPKTQAGRLGEDKEPLAVTIDAQGKIFVQETEVTKEEIVPRLIAIADAGYEERIFVRGDKGVPYGDVMEVMGLIAGAGFTRIGLVTEQQRGPQPQAGAKGQR